MTKIKYICVAILLSMAMSDSYKNPKYELLQKDGKIEIRQYSEYVIAKTSISDGDMQLNSNMFRTLANYIFGANSDKESIPMTAPVITTNDNSDYEMIFFMLDAKSIDELPAPNSSKVSIEKMSIGKAISISFGFWATENRIKRYKKKLDNYIISNNIKVGSELMTAQYNSPWAIPPFRKNELLYKIK